MGKPPPKPTVPIPQRLKDKVRRDQARMDQRAALALQQQRFKEFYTKWTTMNEVQFYPWSQSKKGARYNDIGNGICEGMSLDWLRRSLQGRRNFAEDVKYEDKNSDVMAKLANKHKKIHAMYTPERKKNTAATYAGKAGKDSVAPFAAAYNKERRAGKSYFQWASPFSSGTSGFEKLRQIQQDEIDWSAFIFDGECVAAQIQKQIAVGEKLEPKVPFGLMISFEGAGSGHATAYYHDTSRESLPYCYTFLDPNLGQWRVASSKVFNSLVAELWAATYSHFGNMTVEIICFDDQ